MNEAKSVTATFDLEQHALSVAFAGAGAGTVTSELAGIDCATDCAADFEHGSIVNLTVTPAAGSEFAGWSGACTGETCVVVVDEAKLVTATFDEEGNCV